MEFGMISCVPYYYWGLEHILGAYIVTLLSSPFLFLFGYLPLRVLLRSLSAIYDRFTSEATGVFEGCEFVFQQLTESYGGRFFRSSGNRLVYIPQKNIRIEVARWLDVILTIRVYEQARFQVLLYRIPRLFHRRFATVTSCPEAVADLQRLPGFWSLTRSLADAGFSIQVDRHGLKIWKRLKTGEVFESTFVNLIRVAEDLAKICAGYDPIPVQQKGLDIHCAFCKSPVQKDSVVLCGGCGTPHHPECFDLYSRCSVFGCESATLSVFRNHSLREMDSWQREKS